MSNVLQLPQVPPGVHRSSWAAHREYLDENWGAGEHVSIFCPTGGGKTHLITRGLLPLWDNLVEPKKAAKVLFLDMKGDGDPILKGFAKLTDHFPTTWERRLHEGRPWWRLAVPSLFAGVTRSDQQRTVYEALRSAFNEGGWVVVADEVKPLIRLKLTDWLDEYWERGRAGGRITFIAGSQAPAWMPSGMYDQPSHLYLGAVKDRRRRVRYREIGGWDDELGPALEGIRKPHFLYIGQGGDVAEIVKAPAR